MRAVYWSCVALVSVVLGDAAGCGGRVQQADCGDGRQFCSASNVCCPNFTICGDDKNGCPAGDCCLNTTSHIVDGGADGDDDALSPTELPTPMNGSYGTDPGGGSLPGNGGGGGGGSTGTKLGGDKRS